MTNLLCKILLLRNPKMKTGQQIWQNLLKKAVAQKGCFASDGDVLSVTHVYCL
jgi:hypothetical protein